MMQNGNSNLSLPAPTLVRRPSGLPSARWEGNGTEPGFGETESSGLFEIARALYRRKGTIGLIIFSCVLVAVLISAAQPRMYRSVASLEIQGVNENFLNLRDI